MKATNVMTRDVVCVTAMITAADTYKVMLKKRVRHIPVVSAGVLQGIVSDRDLLRVASEAPDGTLSFPDKAIAEVMTLGPRTANAGTTVSEVAKLFIETKIDCLPIVRNDDVLIGLVTSTDLLALLIDDERLKKPIPFKFDLHVVQAAA